MNRFCSLLVGVAVLLGTAPGCGSGRPKLGTVTGMVRFAEKPIAVGTIIVEVPGKRPSSGKILDGVIRDVTTYDIGDGVPVGVARVAVHAYSPSPDKKAETIETDATGQVGKPDKSGYMGVTESLIPLRYNHPESSGLTVRIEPGENTIALDLQP